MRGAEGAALELCCPSRALEEYLVHTVQEEIDVPEASKPRQASSRPGPGQSVSFISRMSRGLAGPAMNVIWRGDSVVGTFAVQRTWVQFSGHQVANNHQ